MNLSSLIFFYGKDKYKILLFLPGCVMTRDVYKVVSPVQRGTHAGDGSLILCREGGRDREKVMMAVVLQEGSVKKVAVITSQ